MIFYRYLSHVCQFFSYVKMDTFIQMHFCVNFLNNISLPDVASAVMPLIHIISLVVSVIVTVPEHDEPNKVDFVFISICGEFTQTLH